MRPRGESVSNPHDTYVGQDGKQNPQWTQSLMRSAAVRSVAGVSMVSMTLQLSEKTTGVETMFGIEAVFEATH